MQSIVSFTFRKPSPIRLARCAEGVLSNSPISCGLSVVGSQLWVVGCHSERTLSARLNGTGRESKSPASSASTAKAASG